MIVKLVMIMIMIGMIEMMIEIKVMVVNPDLSDDFLDGRNLKKLPKGEKKKIFFFNFSFFHMESFDFPKRELIQMFIK